MRVAKSRVWVTLAETIRDWLPRVAVSRRGQRAGDDVRQRLHNLRHLLAHRHRRRVNLLHRMPKRRRVQRDDWLPLGGGVAGVERGVPLPVLLAQANDDHVCLIDERARPDCVHAGADAVPVRPLLLHPQNNRRAVVAVLVARVRPAEQNLLAQARISNACRHVLPPARVDLARQVDAPNLAVARERREATRPERRGFCECRKHG
mmetsp:Transcript_45033/g.144923  ORF Transcript_45033/g.144923 Transcript_45033/m.144923 type:complete len:205 (-) Transcript_45033:61-675(-)